MTAQQIKWASEHDWYLDHDGIGGVICLDTMTGEQVTFWDFKKLRNWAGY